MKAKLKYDYSTKSTHIYRNVDDPNIQIFYLRKNNVPKPPTFIELLITPLEGVSDEQKEKR